MVHFVQKDVLEKKKQQLRPIAGRISSAVPKRQSTQAARFAHTETCRLLCRLSPLRTGIGPTDRGHSGNRATGSVGRVSLLPPSKPYSRRGSEQAIMQPRTCERKTHMSVTVQTLLC